MEHTLPFYKPKLNDNLNELNVSKVSTLKPEREAIRIKSFRTDDNDFFEGEDADLINIDYDNPFKKVWDDTNKKGQKYKETFPKDDSETDTNLDSTDTEPTDTDLDPTSSEDSIYSTTTDESDGSLDPNTEAHRDQESSPSYHQSEDDSTEDTDTNYFDSDATTESSEQSYTSYSEDVDDSPDASPYEEPPDPQFPPSTGGPPETFQWSEDEQMEIPVRNAEVKTIDPFEEQKKAAREKLGPDFEASADPSRRERKSGISGIFASIAKHLAPKNSVNFESDLLERSVEPISTLGVPAYKNIYHLPK